MEQIHILTINTRAQARDRNNKSFLIQLITMALGFPALKFAAIENSTSNRYRYTSLWFMNVFYLHRGIFLFVDELKDEMI